MPPFACQLNCPEQTNRGLAVLKLSGKRVPIKASMWVLAGALCVAAYAQAPAQTPPTKPSTQMPTKPPAPEAEPADLYQIGFAAYQAAILIWLSKAREPGSRRQPRRAVLPGRVGLLFHTGRDGHLTHAFNLQSWARGA